MKTIGIVATPYGLATIQVGRYPIDGALLIMLTKTCPESGVSAATIFSANFRQHGCNIRDDEFNVRTWADSECLFEPLLSTGLFDDTGRTFPFANIISPIWRLRDPALLPEPLTLGKGGAA